MRIESVRAHRLLHEAAAAVENDDEEFARFLRNRARDLLTDDYEAGDASWIKGHFKHLNAQIGAYETYDDELLGTRAFYSLSLLAARTEESAALRKALQGIQALEDSLPTDRHHRVVEDIPVGVYDVIADFGQARGGNTATNLPNEAYLASATAASSSCARTSCATPTSSPATRRTFSTAVAPEFRSAPDGRRRFLSHAVARGRPLSRAGPHARRPRLRRRPRCRREPPRRDEGRSRLAVRRTRASVSAAISPMRNCALTTRTASCASS